MEGAGRRGLVSVGKAGSLHLHYFFCAGKAALGRVHISRRARSAYRMWPSRSLVQAKAFKDGAVSLLELPLVYEEATPS